ncbi:hypothetical protein F2P81_005754 [Scophthalmus maximus]|uniref:Uncharacterized protein n=1 Tax=Scophthalmus maximus TaxID=52904 RepID=A0A6A4TJG9_SCOMX|nr:hypothetical protein F2P81_005754 [Scophthalmus maximus]
MLRNRELDTSRRRYDIKQATKVTDILSWTFVPQRTPQRYSQTQPTTELPGNVLEITKELRTVTNFKNVIFEEVKKIVSNRIIGCDPTTTKEMYVFRQTFASAKQRGRDGLQRVTGCYKCCSRFGSEL